MQRSNRSEAEFDVANHLLFGLIEMASILKVRGFAFVEHFMVRNKAKALGIIAYIILFYSTGFNSNAFANNSNDFLRAS